MCVCLEITGSWIFPSHNVNMLISPLWSRNNCVNIMKRHWNRPHKMQHNVKLKSFGGSNLCSYNAVAQIGPVGITSNCHWIESKSLCCWRVWNKWNRERETSGWERERADGECVERTRWWVILPQRTLLSGASSGNMCGNTQMDSNSSCCEKQGCV